MLKKIPKQTNKKYQLCMVVIHVIERLGQMDQGFKVSLSYIEALSQNQTDYI